jgi:hypothetical protein
MTKTASLTLSNKALKMSWVSPEAMIRRVAVFIGLPTSDPDESGGEHEDSLPKTSWRKPPK